MEANWVRYCEFRIEQGELAGFLYESVRFWFPFPSGNNFYLADVFVWDMRGNCWIEEVKGFMDGASKTKLNRMRKYYPSIEVRIIDKARYRAVMRWREILDLET